MSIAVALGTEVCQHMYQICVYLFIYVYLLIFVVAVCIFSLVLKHSKNNNNHVWHWHLTTPTTITTITTITTTSFDEMPEQYNHSVYQIFGALKKEWPQLNTMAVLDWETFPSDLPLDIWVDEYADYGTSPSYLQPTAKETLRQTWLRSGHSRQFWWYWCIGPEDPFALNTFVERPAIQARLLYWLTALHAVNGMLCA